MLICWSISSFSFFVNGDDVQYHELAAEAFYLKAMVFDKLGRLVDREEAATSFKKHIMALENPHDEDSLASML